MKVSVVIDTNVWVSAFLRRQGKPAGILRLAAEHKLELLISPPIWEELVDVLHRPHIPGGLHVNIEELAGWLAMVRDLARWMAGKITVEAVSRRPGRQHRPRLCAGRKGRLHCDRRPASAVHEGLQPNSHPLTCGVLRAVEAK